MKATNYKILEQRLAHVMAEEVRSHLAEGWRLHGNLISTGSTLLQAMIYCPDINQDLTRGARR